MKHLFLWFVGVIVISSMAVSVLAADNTIAVFAWDNKTNPSSMFRNEKGELTGWSVDSVIALFKEAGYTPDFQELPYNRAWEELKTGKVEMFPLLYKTPEREEFLYFIGVASANRDVFMVRKENANLKFDTLDDFMKEGILFSIRENNEYSEALNQRLKTDPEFRKHFDITARPEKFVEQRKVAAGRSTGTIESGTAATIQIATIAEFEDLRIIQSPLLQPTLNYFVVSKNISPEKLERLRKAYQTLREQGVFAAIYEKWGMGHVWKEWVPLAEQAK